MFEETLTPEQVSDKAEMLLRRFVAAAVTDGAVGEVLARPTGSFMGIVEFPDGRRLNTLLMRNSDGDVFAIDAASLDGTEKIEIRTGESPSIAYWNKESGRRKNSPVAVTNTQRFILPKE